MKKNKAVYVTCNQTFEMTNGSKKHIKEKHTELWRNYCGKIFRNRNEVSNHMYEAWKSTCHEWISKDEVENYKEDIVVEKEELIMNKKVESKEILRKITQE